MILDPQSPDPHEESRDRFRLLVGLGNPGPKYAGTRHNVGFDVLDLLAHRQQWEPEPLIVGGRRLADLYRCTEPLGGRNAKSHSESDLKAEADLETVSDAPDFALLWPLTYMNLSGGAVAAALRQFEVDASSIFVILDDFNLPLGALRIRAKGSAGGHNGLKSIEQHLSTPAYARMRIGVGLAGTAGVRGETSDFVLSQFRASEVKVLEETLETASWAAEDWVQGKTLEKIQTRYNRRTPEAE